MLKAVVANSGQGMLGARLLLEQPLQKVLRKRHKVSLCWSVHCIAILKNSKSHAENETLFKYRTLTWVLVFFF